MADALAVTLQALAEQTASGEGGAIDIGALRTLLVGAIRVTAKTGSGNVAFELETSPDGTNGWRAVRGLGSLIGVGRLEFHVDECERFVRVKWTLAGITAATFSVAAEAHVLYAKRRDLALLGIQEGALDDATVEKLAANLLSATSDVDDALNTIYTLPLTTWPSSLKQRASDIATWRVMKAIGFQPQGSDEVIRLSFEDAVKWLEKVAQRKIVPAGLTPRLPPAVQTSSGKPQDPGAPIPRMSDNWGDFG
jgi:phage gp36-like protein